MKRVLFLIALIFLAFPIGLKGQTLKIPAETPSPAILAEEKVFVHYNASMLYAGEYLYYKIYTLNSETGSLSGLSKVVYLELVGNDGNAVLKQQVLLENGMGQGDLFIPTSLPSGNYKIIAYTLWMVNGTDAAFFRGDLVLLNPYQGDQSGLSSGSLSAARDNSKSTDAEEVPPSVSDKNIMIDLQDKVVGNREMVTVKLRNINAERINGNISVSVRKTERDLDFYRPSSLEVPRSFSNSGRKNLPTDIFLPELRGSLLIGSLKNPNETSSVSGKALSVYIPGEDHIFKTALTNEDGIFFINLEREYTGDRILVQVVGEPEDYEINIIGKPDIKHSGLEFTSFELTPQMEQRIIERSIHNQIENAYFGVKPDTIIETISNTQFYGESGILYNLDEFKRFPSMRETFVEIIAAARIVNTGEGRSEIRVRPPEGSPETEHQPLLVVDGLLVQDHNLLIEYPVQRVKSIQIIRKKYFNGPLVFQGVIAVKTEDGNFHEQRPSPLVKEFNLLKPQPEKKYFKQVYDQNTKNNRIPDFRYQLAWIPKLEIKDSDSVIEFYTSDITGLFEISIEGFQGNGAPVSIKEYFKVE